MQQWRQHNNNIRKTDIRKIFSYILYKLLRYNLCEGIYIIYGIVETKKNIKHNKLDTKRKPRDWKWMVLWMINEC